MNSFKIRPMRTKEEITHAQQLVRQFSIELGDLEFIEREVNTVGEKYQPSNGAQFLIAYDGDRPAGCLGYTRQIEDSRFCQLRKFYVRPEYRKNSLGSVLIEAILVKAQAAQFIGARLFTVEGAHSAQRLYKKYGFTQVEKYGYCHLPVAIFLEKKFVKNINI